MKTKSQMHLKTNLFIFVISAMISSVTLTKEGTTAIRLSEPVERTKTSETFGASFPDIEGSMTLQQLVDGGDKYLEQEVLVNTRIGKVCQKKGCFFIAQDGDTTMRVSFKDYGFFVPTDSGSKTVDMIGVLTSKHISEKQARHFAKDIGADDSAIKTGMTYEFVASSVRIPVN